MRGPPSPAQAQRASLRRFAPLLVVGVAAAALFAIAFDDGGYALASRGTWAIGVWWAVALGAATGLLRPLELGRASWLIAGLLAALALATLASAAWAANDARAFAEFNRVTLYLGVFLLVSAAAPRAPLGRWCDAIMLALTGIAAVALLSRFLPNTISDRGLADAFPGVASRLSYPVGYWNALAILVALAVPLLLHRAATEGSRVPGALAVAPIPAVAATIYFASSRGGLATAAIGAVAFLVLAHRRWAVAGAAAAAAAGSGVVLWYLAEHPAVANEPLTTSGAARVEAALVVAVGCIVAAVAHAMVARALGTRPVPRPVNVAAACVAVAVAAVAIFAAKPSERLSEFKEPPASLDASEDPIQAHLVSFGGTGRWQVWDSSLEAWVEQPLRGHGAGSFEAWWTENGSLSRFVRDAHSLYLETLAELGALGFLLLAAAVVGGLVAAIVRAHAREDDAGAAATAAFAAFAVAAGIDWMWEVPAVTIVGLSCLALALAAPRPPSRAREAGVAGAVVAVVALALVAAQAVPLLADVEVRASREAAARGDLAAALGHAERGTELQSWAPDPWLQLALVREQAEELERAGEAIRRAVREDARDWRLWLVSARIHTKLGEIDFARRSLTTARTLNPRSPLLVNLERS